MRSLQTFFRGVVPNLGDLPIREELGATHLVASTGKRYVCVCESLYLGDQWKEWDGATIGDAAGGGVSSGELLASVDITDPASIDSFRRVVVGGYSGNGETAYQREAAEDILRASHYISGGICVLLEDDPTQCSLVAPANIVVTPDNLDFGAEFDPVDGTVDHYEWRIDGAGAWLDIGASTSLSGYTFIGTHSIEVRAVTPGGLIGAIGESSDFTSTSDGPSFSDTFTGSGALSGNWTVESGTCVRLLDVFHTSTASSWVPQMAIFTGGACTSVDQYVKLSMNSGSDGTRFPSAYFRFTDAASPLYGIQLNATTGEISWNHYTNATTFGGIVGAVPATVGATDTWGFTVHGTGNNTVVRGWRNPVADSPLSMLVWDGVGPDIEITADPGIHAVNTGNFVGLGGEHHTSANIELDNFHGGNL